MSNVLFEETARSKLCIGIEQLATALRERSKKVSVNQTLASCTSQDPYISMGIAMGKECASLAPKHYADRAVFILESLVCGGLEQMTLGVRAQEVKTGIETAIYKTLDRVQQMTFPLKPQEISWMDPLLVKAIDTGADVILLEERSGIESSIQVACSMHIPSGYASSYFCTHADSVKMESPYIVCVDAYIASIQEILPFLELGVEKKRPLLVLARGIAKDVLSTLAINKLEGTLPVCALIDQSDWTDLRDFIAESSGIGTSSYVIIYPDKTLFIGGKKDGLSKTATIYVEKGSSSQRELSAQVHFVQQTMKEGLVIGGDAALVHASASFTLDAEASPYAEIVAKACQAPFRQRMIRSGENPDIILKQILGQGPDFGFNTLTKRIENMHVAHIFDSSSLVQKALAAVSCTASNIYLTSALIS